MVLIADDQSVRRTWALGAGLLSSAAYPSPKLCSAGISTGYGLLFHKEDAIAQHDMVNLFGLLLLLFCIVQRQGSSEILMLGQFTSQSEAVLAGEQFMSDYLERHKHTANDNAA